MFKKERHMKFIKFCGFAALLFAPLVLFACGSGGGGGSTGTGTLSLNMVDNASDYNAMYITLIDVQIHAKEDVGNNNNSSFAPLKRCKFC
jgi:hypothetical protein